MWGWWSSNNILNNYLQTHIELRKCEPHKLANIFLFQIHKSQRKLPMLEKTVVKPLV